jgi:hypothetical protein
MAWESISENMKVLAKKIFGHHELKQHHMWFILQVANA